MKKLYVGNIPFTVTEDELQEWFENGAGIGAKSVLIIKDRETERSKGFGFIEVDDHDFERGRSLNGESFGGRKITINEAKPMQPKESYSRPARSGQR